MKKSTIIIYLTGKPGVGKYTIATEIAKKFILLPLSADDLPREQTSWLRRQGKTVQWRSGVLFEKLMCCRGNPWKLTQ